MEAAEAGRKAASGGGRAEPEGLPCPRCESTATKFCYYNNYNLAQPRHFCKACRRYWTRGGALRNVPVGGGTRKSPAAAAAARRAGNKRAAAAPPPPPPPPPPRPPQPFAFAYPAAISVAPPAAAVGPDRRLLDLGGSFSSLLASEPDVRYVSFMGSGPSGGAGSPAPPQPVEPAVAPSLAEGLWGGGWPDLAI